MVGIEVGATAITRSDGARMPIDPGAIPVDLLHRVATDAPYVRTFGAECELVPIHEVFADAVECGLRDVASRDDEAIALAVPGWWSPAARTRIEQALADRGIPVLLVNDAEAAVVQALADGVAMPETTAVLSLRSMQTSVVMVRDCHTNPTAMLSPTPVLEEGGHLLDIAVLQHLLRGLDDLGEGVDRSAPGTIAGARTELLQCRRAREALSSSVTESVLPTAFGTAQRVRLLRSELEEIATGWTDAVVGIVRTALEQSAAETDTVLLTGGLASMPLVSQRLSADLGLEAIVADEPQLLAVRGAQTLLERQLRTAVRVPRWRRVARQTAEMMRAALPVRGSQQPMTNRLAGH